jgi:hypothetical protein
MVLRVLLGLLEKRVQLVLAAQVLLEPRGRKGQLEQQGLAQLALRVQG